MNINVVTYHHSALSPRSSNNLSRTRNSQNLGKWGGATFKRTLSHACNYSVTCTLNCLARTAHIVGLVNTLAHIFWDCCEDPSLSDLLTTPLPGAWASFSATHDSRNNFRPLNEQRRWRAGTAWLLYLSEFFFHLNEVDFLSLSLSRLL